MKWHAMLALGAYHGINPLINDVPQNQSNAHNKSVPNMPMTRINASHLSAERSAGADGRETAAA